VHHDHVPPLDGDALLQLWVEAVVEEGERVGVLALEGDAALQGTADQLPLHLWGRPAHVTVAGESAAEAILRGR
jgi:hypothetical protein